ncbi:unnamed protein product [Pseudo-nitzschia multistriata]|uniref:riboflavin kinase n=1 Tax=Pseudo-nitzschia multistriata TaxID=183589 RepID=A0A448YYJ9_9STRA|nr:unnamed protein product [Pseudo-nitzschia multistriata]
MSPAPLETCGGTTQQQQPSEGALPLRLTSVVVRGYGRGSTDLGIPTANLSRENIKLNLVGVSFDDLPTGIYWGFCRVGDNPTIFKTACSIGYNPYYGNQRKTVEPHLIASPGDERRYQSSCGETLLGDLYDQPIRLSLLEYMRPELPFEGLEKLVAAIKKDIMDAERLGEKKDPTTMEEKAWVACDDEPIPQS